MFDSIENLPVYNFYKINETGDFNYLNFPKNTKPEILEKTWSKIYDEFLKEFGLSDKYTKWIALNKQLIEYYKNAYCEGKRHELNFARITEAKIKELDEGEQLSLGELIAVVSEGMGFPVPVKETSVYQFYHYLKYLNGRVAKHNTKS